MSKIFRPAFLTLGLAWMLTLAVPSVRTEVNGLEQVSYSSPSAGDRGTSCDPDG